MITELVRGNKLRCGETGKWLVNATLEEKLDAAFNSKDREITRLKEELRLMQQRLEIMELRRSGWC